jgi:hypothetical protein
MARSKGGLQRNVRSIFQDAAMPDDIHVTPAISDADTIPAPAVSPPTEVPKDEAAPGPEACVSLPDASAIEPQSESCLASEDTGFSDPKIESQMKKQKCEKDFSCYKSGLKDLCKARVIHRGKTVQCLEPKTTPCAYRIFTFFKRLCQCPIRICIAKKHGK